MKDVERALVESKLLFNVVKKDLLISLIKNIDYIDLGELEKIVSSNKKKY